MKKLIILFFAFYSFAATAQQQVINIGTAPNDHTGDPLRTAFTKVNAMMAQLFSTGVTVTPDVTDTRFYVFGSSSNRFQTFGVWSSGIISLSTFDAINGVTASSMTASASGANQHQIDMYVEGSGTNSQLMLRRRINSSSLQQHLFFTATAIEIQDQINLQGAKYNADYSANGIAVYGARWIPDQGYVNSGVATLTNKSINGSSNTLTNIPGTALVNTSVTPGSYVNSNITVDAQGRLTAASSGLDLQFISESTTARTLTQADDGKTIKCSNVGAITITLPNGLTSGFWCVIKKETGAGVITFTATSGTLHSLNSLNTLNTDYAQATVSHEGSNIWMLAGQLGAQ